MILITYKNWLLYLQFYNGFSSGGSFPHSAVGYDQTESMERHGTWVAVVVNGTT